MINTFIVSLFLLSGCIFESERNQEVCIYNNRSDSIETAPSNGEVYQTAANHKLCIGRRTVSPMSLSRFYNGKLLIKDSSGAILFDLTGSKIDDAFTNTSDNYYRLDVN